MTDLTRIGNNPLLPQPDALTINDPAGPSDNAGLGRTTSFDLEGVPENRMTGGLSEDVIRDITPTIAREAKMDLYTFMAVVHELNKELKVASREQREMAREAQYQAHMDAADKIRDAALDRLIGGLVSAGVSIIASAVAMRQAMKAPMGDQLAAQRTFTQAQTINSMGESLGKMGGSVAEWHAAQNDAKKAELDALATRFEHSGQDETEYMNAFQEMMKQIQDTASKLEESEHQARTRANTV